MGRGSNKLTDRTVRSLKQPGRYGDGLGLWLQISSVGTKSWIYRYMLDGQARMMGLGPYPDFSLDEARQKAADCRRLLKDKKDPIDERNAKFAIERLARTKALTFDECSAAYIEANRAGWKNDKHASQWGSTLKTYASPFFGDLPVASIDTGHVLKALEPIWQTKAETASRLRGRIEAVLGWATVRKYRTGDNPATWRNHLDKVLPAASAIAKVKKHHPALAYRAIGSFMADLRQQPGIASLALEFTILTASRTSEVLGAKWSEFDLTEGFWTIPPERMKAKKEHIVPLSGRAKEVLAKVAPLRSSDEDPIFPGNKGKPLSNMAMLKVLERMNRDDLTVHGFRSTFRDWAGETTAYAREVIEHALAHQLKDKAEAAYARGTLFQKRSRLMNDWAAYCARIQGTASVTAIQGKQ